MSTVLTSRTGWYTNTRHRGHSGSWTNGGTGSNTDTYSYWNHGSSSRTFSVPPTTPTLRTSSRSSRHRGRLSEKGRVGEAVPTGRESTKKTVVPEVSVVREEVDIGLGWPVWE